MDQKNIDQYWKKFKKGHKDSFGFIYQYYKPLLFFFCLGKVKSKEIAEGYASEALIKTYTQENPEKIKNLEQWLFTLAKNMCLSYLRTIKRRSEILEEISIHKNTIQSPEIEQNQAVENIDQLIRIELNEIEYSLWKLHAQGFDNDEIALKIEMNSKTVANKKSDIRSRLKKLFKNYKH